MASPIHVFFRFLSRLIQVLLKRSAIVRLLCVCVSVYTVFHVDHSLIVA